MLSIVETAKHEDLERDAPTAAFLRMVIKMRAPMTIMLRPQATILAMFPNEPFCPALRAPQVGLMPTGAIVASAERPVSEVGEFFSSYGRSLWVGVWLVSRRVKIPVGRKDYTKGMKGSIRIAA